MEIKYNTSWLDGIEERVVEAYRKHGLKAKAGQSRVRDGCCCAVGVLAIGQTADPTTAWTTDCFRALGLAMEEGNPFVVGFDYGLLEDPSDPPSMKDTPEYQAGRRTAEAVIAAGLRVDESLGDR